MNLILFMKFFNYVKVKKTKTNPSSLIYLLYNVHATPRVKKDYQKINILKMTTESQHKN